MNKPQWLKTVYEIVFGHRKIVADVEPSSLELALGREGADNLLRDLEEAHKVEKSGDYAGGQVLAKAALLNSALSAAQESFRTGLITLTQRDVIQNNMRSNIKTSTLMDELLETMRRKY
jgi:hypothetical protein